MTAQPLHQPDGEQFDGDHDVIHLGGRTAVVVPVEEYRVLRELRRNATPEELADAEDSAAIADWEAHKAAGTADTVSGAELRRRLGLRA
jgi:hypothetical protein